VELYQTENVQVVFEQLFKELRIPSEHEAALSAHRSEGLLSALLRPLYRATFNTVVVAQTYDTRSATLFVMPQRRRIKSPPTCRHRLHPHHQTVFFLGLRMSQTVAKTPTRLR
jgi:hypothetical protein